MRVRTFQTIPRRRPMFIICFLHCFVAGLLVVPHSIAMPDGVDVDGFLADFEKQRATLSTYAARFVQKKTLALFGDTKVSTGLVLYKSPQQMMWKYETPDATQMRIDRESVSFYFPELKQIEVYPLEKGKGAKHLFFAFEASAEELKDSFAITLGGTPNGETHRIELAPKSDTAAPGLERITLWLGKSDYLPRKILIREVSGDTTEVRLSEIRVNETIADDEMQFDAPEGTQVIQSDSGAL